MCDVMRACAHAGHLLAEEALASMPGSSTEVEVETPHGVWNCGVQSVPTRSVCVVDIMRSGCILLEAATDRRIGV